MAKKKKELTIQELLNTDPAKLTTRELRTAIRQMTGDINIRILEYRNTGKTSKTGEMMIARLQSIGGKGRASRNEEVGRNLSYARKGRLITQYIEYKRFLERERFTPQGKESATSKYEKRFDKAYNTFMKRYGVNLSKEDFEQLGHIISALKNTILADIYDEAGKTFATMYAEADEHGKINFIDFVSDAYNQAVASGNGTWETVADILAEKLE